MGKRNFKVGTEEVMSALQFMTSGGMASIGGNMKPSAQERIQELAGAFGRLVSRLAAAAGVPRIRVRIWAASFFLGAIDTDHIFFIFADSLGETQLILVDQQDGGQFTMQTLVTEVKRDYGDPLLGFWLPISALDQERDLDEVATMGAARSYIEGLLANHDTNTAGTNEMEETLCFIIMSFSRSPGLQDFYEKSIKPTVESLGYQCERVDEQEFNGSIRDRILDNIRRARFIVADMTEARPNCYYELGVAHSLGKEVIHLSNKTEDIHFDIKDFNFIVYSRLDELSDKLRKRIEATVGPGR